ncbi:MAG TPA: HlyD family type I secretion periplasmic adaptor subunit [Nitrosomonas nitrosa]|jgi:protease secretion system membrane fusion protein|uniref:Membrane fusion protein (MFP) family protein n=1 Tax=Nitrosomonas nitrosa TaxID=52442 RepID=A0A1I4R5Y2_9PROT|nr:HlyD family type I secretion periplasmic adaptor subunit [Nitrosomonas nitrosa]MCO6434211.1 HlyD family type I secretion periplasmic adaptor subunit [Nitrosomonas nitrosa]PTR00176.1 protease secretion system membrane fusion protein [Nitrosomonas nitrosa]CAE6509112.1 Proteases secretion protein PrtE [Nitrosomonas nitrosa]SFM47565.1 membrane fusion protein, protease secretion system [Nitrosomonas nitrosa]HBZ29597.1 HlyD family type I secretion periplasmic adaptor subunit [Nitrosomonas nitrosa
MSHKDATVLGNAIAEDPGNVKTDETRHARLGWWIVLVGVGGFFLWATFAPLDKGVPLSGSVMVATNRKAVQHQTGGIVEDILVKEGDLVKEGQVLVKMNDIQVKAQAEITRGQLIAARAIEARLIAERDNKPEIDFPPFLQSVADDPRVIGSISLQKQLFVSRQSVLKHELAALDENIAGLTVQLRGLESSRTSKLQQLEFLKEQLDNMRVLAQDGYVPRNRVLELERTHAQLTGDISEDTGNIGRIQRQISELNLRRVQRLEEHQKEVRQQLTDVQREAEALNSRLLAQDFELANVLVKAPVDGIVVGINIFTRGGVIGPGFRMMDIVPSEDMLVIEGQVPVHLIDKVHAGLDVDFIFTAFNQNKIPRVPGIVTNVSADRLTDERTGVPYYQLKAKVTPEGMKILTDWQIRAGMPVEIFVKTGERSLMNYLLKPILDRIHTSLVED